MSLPIADQFQQWFNARKDMRLDVANKKQRAVIKSEKGSTLSGDYLQAPEIDLTSDSPTERMVLRPRVVKVEGKVARPRYPANGTKSRR